MVCWTVETGGGKAQEWLQKGSSEFCAEELFYFFFSSSGQKASGSKLFFFFPHWWLLVPKHSSTKAAEGLHAINASCCCAVEPLCSHALVKHIWKKWWPFPPKEPLLAALFWQRHFHEGWGGIFPSGQWRTSSHVVSIPVCFLNQPVFWVLLLLWAALRLFQCQQSMLLPLPGSFVKCCVLHSGLWSPVGWQTEGWVEIY